MTDEGALAAPFHEVVPFGPDTDEPTPRKTRAEVAVEALKAAPNLVKLCFRLLSDPRVPRRTKVLLGVSGLYVLSPIDLIPELLLPVVGRVSFGTWYCSRSRFSSVFSSATTPAWAGSP